MKKHAFILGMLLSMNQGFAQELIEVSSSDQNAVAKELEKEASSDKHDKQTKILLKKVAERLKSSSKVIKLEVQKLDDCEYNCVDKTKEQIVFRNVGRKLGKGASWLTTTTSKPFLNAAGFLTGLFEKKDKNKDIVALYQFFLNHSKEMDQLYLEAGTPEEMVELLLSKIEEIVEKKSKIILKDFLVSLGIKRDIPQDLSDFELTENEISSIDMDKLTGDFINNHHEYEELKAIIGEVTEDEITDIIISGYFDKSIGFENYKAALPKIHEGAISLVGQIFGPKIVLGIISGSLASLYATPVVIADIGTAVSTAICLKQENQDKFESDKDLRSFCSYVVNRSAYQLMKSRAKGFVSGKKMRTKIEQQLQARKERRAAKKKLNE